MKGMLDFLEKAGLVKRDEASGPMAEPAEVAHGLAAQASASPLNSAPESAAPVAQVPGASLNLDSIYAQAGVGPSLYPAERLLRLMDGLSAMDAATRLMAIQAMDAADESWSIEDPLADAAAKAQALAAHSETLQHHAQALATETQARLNSISTRRDQVVGDIRKQIAELEALVERELARAAQETAAQEAALKEFKDQAEREMAAVSATRQRLLGLSQQFGAATPPTQDV
ncbi:MAG: methyl-accepting chemotaxis protein [Rhodoferax sp.]|nr:methyl-accepting chemotaxis protein [Rhodoferax sp.]